MSISREGKDPPGGPGREGSRCGDGMPKGEDPNWEEGLKRNRTPGISEREGCGEGEGGGSHTYPGDLGMPPWSGEPGAYICATRMSPRFSLGATKKVSLFLRAGRQGQEEREPAPRRAGGWGHQGVWSWGFRRGRFGSSKMLQLLRRRQRSREEANMKLRVATVDIGFLWNLVINSCHREASRRATAPGNRVTPAAAGLLAGCLPRQPLSPHRCRSSETPDCPELLRGQERPCLFKRDPRHSAHFFSGHVQLFWALSFLVGFSQGGFLL